MQMTKCELLRTSKDLTIVNLYKTRETLNAKLTRTWKATKALTVANAEVDLNLNFPSQQNTQGLGFGIFNPNPTCSERRKLISAKVQLFMKRVSLLTQLLSNNNQNGFNGQIAQILLISLGKILFGVE